MFLNNFPRFYCVVLPGTYHTFIDSMYCQMTNEAVNWLIEMNYRYGEDFILERLGVPVLYHSLDSTRFVFLEKEVYTAFKLRFHEYEFSQ